MQNYYYFFKYTKAMIDTCANKSVRHDSLVPKENRNKLRNLVNIRQFNGELMQIS